MKNISQKRITQSVPPARMANIAQGRVAVANPSAAVESSLHRHWESLPLRLFLGIIFFFAGVDKVTDPTFFDPTSGTYIGAQLQGYVTYNHSPLSFLLTSVAIPHAQLFGWLFALGELAVGLFALIGLYTRATAALGLLLSTTLWLTASWGQQPFYTSWDLPYMFGWLTLLLIGAGMFSLDEWRDRQQVVTVATPVDHERRNFLVRTGAMVGAVAAVLIAGGEVFSGFASRNQSTSNTGATRAPATKAPTVSGNTGSVVNPTSIPTSDSGNVATAAPTDTLAPQNNGSGAALASPQPTDTLAPAAPTDTPAPAAGPIDPPTPTAAAPAGTLIAHTSDVPVGGGLLFTAPDTGDDAYVVHLGDGRYVAFDAICTHQGCTVNYDSQNTIFFCPCHGAEFDPTNDGAVIRRPARAPLTKLNISVDQASGSIYFISS